MDNLFFVGMKKVWERGKIILFFIYLFIFLSFFSFFFFLGHIHVWNTITGKHISGSFNINKYINKQASTFPHPLPHPQQNTKNIIFIIHITVLTGQHTAPVRSVLWNPTYMVLASACSNLALWQPLK